MLNIFVVYVENKPGVLTRVASLFRRRAFNIDSLTVGRTEKPEVSRMTIVVDADHDQALRVEANLYKLVNVLLVENITGKPSICHFSVARPPTTVASNHDRQFSLFLSIARIASAPTAENTVLSSRTSRTSR